MSQHPIQDFIEELDAAINAAEGGRSKVRVFFGDEEFGVVSPDKGFLTTSYLRSLIGRHLPLIVEEEKHFEELEHAQDQKSKA